MKNIAFFEKHQSYFMGFGLFFALVTDFSFVLSSCIFALLMPIFMLTSISAAPLNFSSLDLNKI